MKFALKVTKTKHKDLAFHDRKNLALYEGKPFLSG